MPPNLAARNCFFVNYVGTDDPGYNAIGAPWSYRSLSAALTALAGVANPPSATNPWTIAIGPGVITEIGFEIPPWVWITGSADAESSDATEIDISSDVTLHPAWANGAGKGGLANLVIRPASGNPRLDLVMPAPSSGNPQRILELFNVRTNIHSSILEASGSGDVFRGGIFIQDGSSSDTITLIGGSHQFDNAVIAAAITAEDTAALALSIAFHAVFLGSTSSLTVLAANKAVTATLLASQLRELTLTQSGSGSLAAVADAVSIPLIADVSLGGTATLTRLSDAFGEGYSPSTPANWPIVPDTVQQALDELASGTPSPAKYPIGTILPFASVPNDGGTWLAENGQVVSQATYPALYSLIGQKPAFAWKRTSFSNANMINSVCWGNSVYVFCGNAGNIWTTPDLITFTLRTSGVVTNLNDVIWSPTASLFIAVGASNVILTSPDGITWTSRSSGVTSTLATVLDNGSEIVAVGSAGWITYSTNGTTWTTAHPSSTPNLAYLIYYNGVWFSMASGTAASGNVYSLDGITWNYTAPVGATANFYGFANNLFFQAASTTAVYSSPTGATWTLVGNVFYNGLGFGQSPVSWPSGVINVIGTGSVQNSVAYSDDFFATTKPIVAQSGLYGGTSVTNSLGDTTQKFVVMVAGPFLGYSADGIQWSYDASGLLFSDSLKAPLTNKAFANGYYFLFTTSSSGFFIYAAAPYDPTTQFQLPVNNPTNALQPLYIKAL